MASDSAPVEEVLGVADAATRGTHRQLLVALRNRVAKQVADEDCPARDLAALTRRLQEIAKEIEAIDAREKQEREAESGESAQDESFDAETI